MRAVPQQQLERARKAWDERARAPEAAAREIAGLLTCAGMTPYQVALQIGARPAEVTCYVDLAALDDNVRRTLITSELPISLATDLLGDPIDTQLAVVRETAAAAVPGHDLVALFQRVLSQHRLQNTVTIRRITGRHLGHLAKKAKQYDVLLPKQRAALVSLGQQVAKGLTAKQEAYANSLLEKLQEKNILTAACGDDPCTFCDDLRKIVRGA